MSWIDLRALAVCGPACAGRASVRRAIAAYSRRVATGDIDALDGMAALAADLDTAIAYAVTALRARHGYSWADIGTRLGITRQAAQQHWGATPAPGHDPGCPRPSGSCP